MEFNKKYNRLEFVDFLKNKFLPEDFIAETTSVDIERQTKYIRSVTKLGSSELLDLVVYEIRHGSIHDARVGLSKEAFVSWLMSGKARHWYYLFQKVMTQTIDFHLLLLI